MLRLCVGLWVTDTSSVAAGVTLLRTEIVLRTVPVFRSASSDCAPNQPFRLLRCSAWLILHEQSTGLFIPKRSCSRASPLRGAVHRTVYSEALDLQGFAPPIALKGKPCGGRGEQSVCAAQPPGPSLLSLSSALFYFHFLSFLLVYKSGKKGDSSWRKGRFAGNFQEKRRFLREERRFFRE